MGRLVTLDALDLKILKYLQENARTNLSELSRKVGAPRSTIANRLEKLEKIGLIRGYHVQLDLAKLGFQITAFVLIRVKRGKVTTGISNQVLLSRKICKDANSSLELPWVEEAHVVTGEYDLLLKIRVKDWNSLTKFLIDYLAKYDEVEHTLTMLTLTTVYENHSLPIEKYAKSIEKHKNTRRVKYADMW